MNEEIKAASVDSPELEVLLRRVREAKSWDFDDRKAALIAHINAWADERCNTAINQLAASRAVLPVTDSQREPILMAYAATDLDGNYDVGRTIDEAKDRAGPDCDTIIALHDISVEFVELEGKPVGKPILATPVAGWVGVERDAKFVAAPSDDVRESDAYRLGWIDGMKEGAELATGGEKTAADVESEFAALLPSCHYMDPPDGGDVSVLEQVRRMAEDAARYRWLRHRDNLQAAGLVSLLWYEELDAAIDAAMTAPPAPVTPKQEQSNG